MNRRFPESLFRALPVAATLIGCTLSLAAQQPSMPNAATQREAMKKLAFLAGHWSGPVSIARGPGEPLKLTQTENVQYKLDGLVLLIEGQSTGSHGNAQFQALATIAYDDSIAHIPFPRLQRRALHRYGTNS